MATIMFKVFALTMKTASKPLAKQIEKYVMNHPVIRPKVINIAQWLHRLDVRMTRGAEGKVGKVFVGDMAEDKAVQLASTVVSEGAVYSIAFVLLILETNRRSQEDAIKKAKQLEEKAEIKAALEQHTGVEVELRQQQIELKDILARIDERLTTLETLLPNINSSSGSEGGAASTQPAQ